jgi:hypothetical protein
MIVSKFTFTCIAIMILLYALLIIIIGTISRLKLDEQISLVFFCLIAIGIFAYLGCNISIIYSW